MIVLTSSPLDLVAAEAHLQEPSVGGIVTFAGTVRNHNHGREVLYLDYEAYEGMALPMLTTIADEMKRRWPLVRVAILHRIGHLDIGDAAVFIGAASAHREAAFDACRYGIETLKRDVPIWKREVFVGGQVWVDTCCTSGAHDRPAEVAHS
jgi:molybdopterin synthase catalytic subunit